MRANLLSAAIILFLLTKITTAQSLLEQRKTFTRSDTLRGALRPERACYDVTFYELNIKIDTGKHSITGSSKIFFKTLHEFTTLQIDLYKNMEIASITSEGKELKYKREFNAVF